MGRGSCRANLFELKYVFEWAKVLPYSPVTMGKSSYLRSRIYLPSNTYSTGQGFMSCIAFLPSDMYSNGQRFTSCTTLSHQRYTQMGRGSCRAYLFELKYVFEWAKVVPYNPVTLGKSSYLRSLSPWNRCLNGQRFMSCTATSP